MKVQIQIYNSIIQYSLVCLCTSSNANMSHDRMGVIRMYLLKFAVRKRSNYLHVITRKEADNYLNERVNDTYILIQVHFFRMVKDSIIYG